MNFGKYNLIDTKEKLIALDKYLITNGNQNFKMKAFDTETNGLQLHKNTVIGFSLSVDSKSGFYIPFLKWVPDEKTRYDRTKDKVKYKDAYKDGNLVDVWTGEFFNEFVTPKEYNLKERHQGIIKLLDRWTQDTKLIMHNAPFDVTMLDICSGLDLTDRLAVDTALLVHILDENESTALKKCIERFRSHLGVNPYALMAEEKKELFNSIIQNGGNKAGEVWRASLDFQSKYACFKEKSAIVTVRGGGSKFIEDIDIGEEVLTHKGRYRKVYSKNSRLHEGDIYSLSLESGRKIYNVTEEHPFLVLNEKTLKEEWIKVKDLKIGHLIKKSFLEDNNEKDYQESELFWYLFGLYQADGYIRIQKNNKYLVITQHENEAPHTKSIMEALGYKVSEQKKNNSKGVDLIICDSNLASKILDYSGGKFKAWEKKVSHKIFTYLLNNKNAALNFIGGVLDGDSHVRKMKNRPEAWQLELKITSQSLINQLDLLLNNLEINTYRAFSHLKNGRRTVYSLLLTKNSIVKINSNLKLKKADLKIDKSECYKQYVRIKKVDKTKESCRVYNISVEEDESYTCNGLITHNCADTFYTFGVCEAGLKQLSQEYGPRGLDWFFNKEVMPVCREVVIPMKKKGVYTDVPHFKKIHSESIKKLEDIEDEIIEELNSKNLLEGFNLGKSIDEEVKEVHIIKKIMELEKLEPPYKKNAKGEWTPTFAKGEVKKHYQEDPHWLWGYIIGEDELKYSKAKLDKLKEQIYVERLSGNKSDLEPKKRYRFNINSGDHLAWLFCDKLGEDRSKLPQTDKATKENPKPSFDANCLKDILLPKYPFVSKILSYKKLAKQESTYMRPVLELNVEGWLYMNMKQNGTTSGRFSCSGGYNLQTLPRVEDEKELLDECGKCGAKRFDKNGKETGDIEVTSQIEVMADRKCLKCGDEVKDVVRPSVIKRGFIAPPGYKIINADYSSLEPRIFAFMSGEDKLKDVYRKGLDLYSQVYCDMFDKDNLYSSDPKMPNFLKKANPAARKSVKPFVLGVPYGAEDAQVARQIGAYIDSIDKVTGEKIQKLNVAEGKRIRDAYLAAYPKLNRYMDDMELSAVTRGYVETIVGRRRHLKNSKIIKDCLDKFGIDYLDLRKAPSYMLKGSEISSVNNKTGVMLSLPEEALKLIAEELGKSLKDIKQKDGWKYIRHILKEDLNNAKNNPIQGLAGHITNKGMLDTTRLFKQSNLDALVFLQVHDEISCYVKDEENSVKTGISCLKKGMEDNEFAKLVDIPMVADPLECYNLEDAK